MSENTQNDGAAAKMTGLQYEALCRHAISRIYGVAVGEIRSGHLAGMSNSREKIRHQIDLYWTASDGVCEYTVFANAKWKSDEKLQMGDIMQLIGVWRDIGVHKAMLITNVGFDIGVRRQAREKGIALLIVKPAVDLSELGTTRLEAVVEQVERIAGEKGEGVFVHEVVHKGFGGIENGKWKMENGGARLEDARAGEKENRGAVEEEGASGGTGEGESTEGGMWLIGGVGGEDVQGIENKALGSGEIPNKIARGVWRKG